MSNTTHEVKLTDDALRALVQSKGRDISMIIDMLNDGIKANPGARMNEALFLKSWLDALTDGKWKEDRIMKGLSGLPTAVGKVNVLNNALGVHLGVLKTSVVYEDLAGNRESYPILGVKKNPMDKAEPWVDYYELMEKLGDNPEKHGWRQKETGANGFAYVTCPGWGIVSPDGKSVVDHHSCGKVFLSSEGWHGWRCPSCKALMETVRGTAKSRGSVEKSIVSITNKILKGGVKRILF